MFVRNLLQAGDNVTIVPAGIRITLKYDEKGQIETVYVGYKEDKVEHEELRVPLVTSKEVPAKIAVKQGTTFVYGCLYTDDVLKVEGNLSCEVESSLVNHYLENAANFHFFAGHMESGALGLNSPVTIQRWLKTAGFNTLPEYLAPANLRENSLSAMINMTNYTFRFPRIMGYMIYRGGSHEFLDTNLNQIVIKDIKKFTSSEGYVLAEIKTVSSKKFAVSYADVVNRKLNKDTVVLINEDNQIVDSYNDPNQKLKEYGRTVTCEYCGKVIEIPAQSVKFTCTDEHCISVLYPRVSRMLSKFGLEVVDFNKLKEFSKGFNNIVALPDILDIEEYKDIMVEIELPKLLEAIVPSTIVTRYQDWVIFCNSCNNSVDSVLYYIQNPSRILSDLKVDPAVYRRLVAWLEDNDNQLDVIGMLQHSKISVISTGKRFEGAPIFRGKSIYLTGRFSHGSFEDVKAILSSYSADVYEKFNTAVDCVIVGGLHEGVSGQDIKRARSMQIPVFEEDEFFAKYEIDDDLAMSMQN